MLACSLVTACFVLALHFTAWLAAELHPHTLPRACLREPFRHIGNGLQLHQELLAPASDLAALNAC